MSINEGIAWFNSNFGSKVRAAIEGLPFPDYFFPALALTETGYIWRQLITNDDLSTTQILELCVGDIIDAPRRKWFPRNKEDLEAYPNGDRMFNIARKSLLDLNVKVSAYRRSTKDASFCRGYGIFQYDLQYFKPNASFFLEKKWASFDECLTICLGELKDKKRGTFGNKSSLTDTELVYVAIAYNRGSADLKKGFAQGHNGTYGIEFNENLIAAKKYNAGGQTPPVLKKGSRGIYVTRWQQFLLDQGFDPNGVDGKFGADTESATIEFQRKYNLRVDGKVGEETYGQAVKLGFKITPGE